MTIKPIYKAVTTAPEYAASSSKHSDLHDQADIWVSEIAKNPAPFDLSVRDFYLPFSARNIEIAILLHVLCGAGELSECNIPDMSASDLDRLQTLRNEIGNLARSASHAALVKQAHREGDKDDALLEGQIESNKQPGGRVYDYFLRKIKSILVSHLREEAVDPMALQRVQLLHLAPEIKAVADQAQRLLKIYHGTYGESFKAEIQKHSQKKLLQEVLSPGPFNDNVWPDFLSSQRAEAEPIKQLFKELLDSVTKEIERQKKPASEAEELRIFAQSKELLSRLFLERTKQGFRGPLAIDLGSSECQAKAIAFDRAFCRWYQNMAREVSRFDAAERGKMIPLKIKTGQI